MNQTILIIPFFGKFREWSPLFFHSVAYLKNIKILLVTDSTPENLNENIILIKMSFEEVKNLIDNKLNLSTNFNQAYKLTDFKPAYGIIFEEYLKNYIYWGHCDEDLIFGDMDHFLEEPIHLNYDIISSQAKHISGHFTIYKNTSSINNLFKSNNSYLEAFTDSQHWGFDEISWFKNQDNSYYEHSITAILKEKEALQEVKVKWGLPIKDDLMFKNESFKWSSGHLHDQNNQEFSYYHWNNLKRGVFFKFPRWRKIPETYYFNFWGFYLDKGNELNRLKNYLPISLSKFIYFLKTRKYY